MEVAKSPPINAEQYGLEPAKANELIGNLPDIKLKRDFLTAQFNEVAKMDINDPETLKVAKELRLRIRDNRTKEIMVWHKTTKEYFLRGGQFVDAIKNKEVAVNERMEDDLAGIEKHFENLEKEKIQKTHSDRLELLSPFVEDTENLQLGIMDEDVWEAYLEIKKKKYDEKVAEEHRIEEEKLEKQRIENLRKERTDLIQPYYSFLENKDSDLSELSEVEFLKTLRDLKTVKKENDEAVEKQRKENERLKAEKESRKERAEKLRPYLMFIRDYETLVAKNEEDFEKEFIEVQDAAIAHNKHEAKKEQARLDAIAENAKLEAELKAKKEADEKKEADRIAAEEKSKAEALKRAKAPVKKKLSDWVEEFNIDTIPADLEKNEKALLIKEKFNSFKNWATAQVESI